MAFRPLRGRVMVRLLPADKLTASGLALPDDMPVSAEVVQERNHNPKPPPGLFAIVESIGPWPIKKGRYHPPEFKTGDKVVIGNRAGEQFSRGINERLRVIKYEQVLAVVEEQTD